MESPALHEVDFYLADPHAAYAQLRRESPVHWFAPPIARDGGGMWVLSKWEDIRFVSKHPKLFSSAHGMLLNDRLQDAGVKRADYAPQAETIVMLDPPRHAPVRNLVSSVFTPRRVAELEGWMRELCAASFDDLPRDEPIDLVSEIAAPIPALSIARILGVPRERWRHFQECANAMIEVAAGDPSDRTVLERHGPKLGELTAYLSERALEKRETPGDDLLSALAHVEEGGLRFEHKDVLMMAMTLLGAGNETTRTLIAQACWALARQRDQLEALVSNPARIEGAIEEFLRYVTPVHSHARTATEAVEVRGQTIAAGDYVVMLYASGNRDEEVWPDGEVLDVTRDPETNPHLSLGHGEHFCLGAHLARLEARVVFEEFLSRFPNYELAGPPERLRSTHINGLVEMPVILGAA
jgi:cytochrome P450